MDKKGIWYALTAYILWGVLPIYWKQLQAVPSLQILAHRITWSLVFLVLVLAYQKNWSWLRPALQDKRTVLLYLAASVLLGINWGLYIWAVNAGFIVETSLGYFINPLVSVFFGTLFFKETLRPWQWVAIATAAAGVIYLTVSYGQPPWISLALAFSFAIYGVLKKQASLGSFEGLTLETAGLIVPALLFLIYVQMTGSGAIGQVGRGEHILLVFTGIATTAPLLFFAAAAPRIPLSTIGILQYSAPTIQFILGVFIYDEPFTTQRFIGFAIIWLALAIYTAENLNNRRLSNKLALNS